MASAFDELSDVVASWRVGNAATRVEALSRLVRQAVAPELDVTDPVSYALVQHAVYEAKASSSARDEARARRAVDVLHVDVPRVSVPLGEFAVVRADQCRRSDDPLYASPVYCISTPVPDPPDPVLREEFAQAAAYIQHARFERWVRPTIGVMVWTRRIDVFETSESHSLRTLPGTVYTDWSVPVRLAETVVHEASHSWLNEAVGATGTVVPPEPELYSPWKKMMRPPFGVLHALLAFANVVLFLRAVAGTAGSPQAEAYIDARLKGEIEVLGASRGLLTSVLSLVREARIAEVVSRQVSLATEQPLP